MQSVFFYFSAPVAVGRLPRSLPVLLRRLHGRLADVLGEMDRAGRPDLLRLPQPDAHSTGSIGLLASLLFILCFAPIGRAMSLDRVRAVRAAKRQGPRGTAAALHQPLGRRLHAADADPDGGAVLLQRHQQTARGRLVERRRRMERVHHRRVLQRHSSWTCSRRTTGWSMSRPMARS